LFRLFGRASGAVVNLEKCNILAVAGFDCIGVPAEIRRVNDIKINGVYFGPTSEAANAAALKAKVDGAIRSQGGRTLSIFGKALIVNIAILSKLWYVGAVAPLPRSFIQSIIKSIFNFIFPKLESVGRTTTIGPPERGGLGVYSIADRLQAYQAHYVARLFSGPLVKWHLFAMYWAVPAARDFAPEFWNNRDPRTRLAPRYYRVAFAAFRRFRTLAADISFSSASIRRVYSVFLEQIFVPPRVEVLRPAVDFGRAWQAVSVSRLTPGARATVWRIIHETLPVTVFLLKYRMTTSSICPLCQSQAETIGHLFMRCTFVRPIWARLEAAFRLNFPLLSKDFLYFNFFKTDSALAEVNTIVVSEVVHAIWLCRNRTVWEKEVFTAEGLAAFCLGRLRGRIKADFGRFAPNVFDDLWGGLGPSVRVGPSGLSLKL